MLKEMEVDRAERVIKIFLIKKEREIEIDRQTE